MGKAKRKVRLDGSPAPQAAKLGGLKAKSYTTGLNVKDVARFEKACMIKQLQPAEMLRFALRHWLDEYGL